MPEANADNPAAAAPREQGLVSNFFSLLAGTACVQLINVGYFTLAARIAGADIFGVFSFLIAFTTILQPLVDFGRTPIIMREIAIADAPRRHRLLQEAWWLQLLFSMLVMLTFCGIAWWTPKLSEHFWNVVLMSLGLVFNGPASVIQPFFVGVKRMLRSSAGQVVSIVSKAILGIGLLLCGFELPALIGATSLSLLIGSLYYLVEYRRHTGHTLAPRPAGERRVLLKDGGQVMLSQLTNGIFNRFDWIFLGSMKASAMVGVYAIAYRLFELMLQIPATLAISVFPNLCQQEATGNKQDDRLMLALKLALLPGCLALPFCYWWAEPALLAILGPEYQDGGLILTLLCISLPFHGCCGFFYYLSVAKRRQRFLVLTSGASTVLNVLACVILIPLYGPVGAALAMTAPSLLQFLLLAFAAEQTSRLGQLTLAGLRMLALAAVPATAVGLTGLHWIPAVVLTAAVVVPLLWHLGGLSTDEQAMLLSILSKLKVPGLRKLMPSRIQP